MALSAPADAAADTRELRVILDQPYVASPSHAHGKDRLDLYVPAGAERAPVLLWIHGGGLFMGDKSVARNVGIAFASAGYLVANVNHRLSPEVSHPGHVRDVATAFAWLRANVERFGGDPSHIVVGGHSAGGYLAGLVCSDARWLEEVGASLDQIKGCLPLSGFFHVERLAPERPKHVWGRDAGAWPDASPANHIGDRIPPVHLVWAEEDVEARKTTNLDFEAALRAAGVKVSGVEIAERDHRSLATMIGTPRDATTEDVLAWLQSLD